MSLNAAEGKADDDRTALKSLGIASPLSDALLDAEFDVVMVEYDTLSVDREPLTLQQLYFSKDPLLQVSCVLSAQPG